MHHPSGLELKREESTWLMWLSVLLPVIPSSFFIRLLIPCQGAILLIYFCIWKPSSFQQGLPYFLVVFPSHVHAASQFPWTHIPQGRLHLSVLNLGMEGVTEQGLKEALKKGSMAISLKQGKCLKEAIQ